MISPSPPTPSPSPPVVVEEAYTYGAGLHSAVGSASDSRARSPGFATRSGRILTFSHALIQEVISYWRKNAQLVLASKPVL